MYSSIKCQSSTMQNCTFFSQLFLLPCKDYVFSSLTVDFSGFPTRMSIPVILDWLIPSHKSQLLHFQEFCELVDITLVIWMQWLVQFSCSGVSNSFNYIISIQWYQEYLLLESVMKYKAGLNWGEENRGKEMLNTASMYWSCFLWKQ